MKLQDIWDIKEPPKEERTLRRTALRWLVRFLALMLACTFLSRAADSLTVAEVQTVQPSRGQISHEVKADGRLASAGESAVNVLDGALVQTVHTRQGARVKAGDPLFTLDPADLKERLTRGQLELQKLNLELSDAQERLRLEDEKKSLAIERAQEDFDFAVDRNRNKLVQLGEDRRYARQELRSYVYENDIDEDLPRDEQDSTYLSLKDAYHRAQRDYEDAESAQVEDMAKAERAIEDANTGATGVEAQKLALDIRLKQLDLSHIQTALAGDCVVAAPSDGIVTGLSVSVGKRTSREQAAVLLTGAEADLRFTAEITKEQSKFVSVGSEMEILLPSAKETILAKVESLETAEDPEKLILSATLPAGTGAPGMAAEASITKVSGNYDTCLPLSAVRTDGTQKFVLTVRETETPLGKEQSAERLDVTLTEENGILAAVSGPLWEDTIIITTSGKPIEAGDRVRLQTP